MSEESLYRADYKVISLITLKNGETIYVNFRGDILVAGSADPSESFNVSQVKRFTRVSEDLDELGGVISMSGPIGEPARVSAPKQFNQTAYFQMYIYYPTLKTKTGDNYTFNELDAFFPPLKVVNCTLNFYLGQKPTSGSATAAIILEFNFPETDHETQGDLADIKELQFTMLKNDWPTFVDFKKLKIKTNTDQSQPHEFKELAVCFIPLAKKTSKDTLEEMIGQWLAGAREVWGKAGLIIKREDNKSPKSNAVYSNERASKLFNNEEFFYLKEPDDERAICQICRQHDIQAINIYLIDLFNYKLKNEKVPGITHMGGTDSAYVILSVEREKEKPNKYLLAHELGHVLGLLHPRSEDPVYQPGSRCSVMEVGKADNILKRNTEKNMRMVEDTRFPLFGVLKSQDKWGSWQPDSEEASC